MRPVSLTRCTHELGGQAQLAVGPQHSQGGDVAVALSGLLLPAHQAKTALGTPDTPRGRTGQSGGSGRKLNYKVQERQAGKRGDKMRPKPTPVVV
jgi:hypothetical protein